MPQVVQKVVRSLDKGSASMMIAIVCPLPVAFAGA
jgi:hypothetical protein